MQMAVYLEGFPEKKISDIQAELLETALVEQIKPADSQEPVGFVGSNYEDGVLIFTCANEGTKVWLKETVPTLSPWEGAKLLVQTGSDMKELQGSGNAETDVGENKQDSAEPDSSKGKESERRPTNPMEVAVVLQGFPEAKMTKSQANGLEAKLVGWLKKSPSDEPVQFLETNFENGVVIFTCGNDWTKKWLMETVSQLDGWAKFEAGPADVVLYGSKLILWVSKLMKKRETEQILELLEKQNKGMSTKQWRIMERKDLPKQASLIMWIDEDSHKFLKERKFRIHLGLGQATFKPAPVFKTHSDSGPSRGPDHRYVSNNSTRGRYRKYVYPKPPPLMHVSVRMPNTQGSRGYSYRGSNPSYGRRYPTQRSTQYYNQRYMPRNTR